MMDNIKLLYVVRQKILYFQGFLICLFFMLFYLFDLKGSAFFLLLLSCYNVAVYAYIFYKEFTLSPVFHPFMIFPLVAIQYLGLNGISLYGDLSSGEPIYFGIYKINSYITTGTLYLTLEHFLIFWGYYIYDWKKRNYDDATVDYMSLHSSNFPYKKWAIYIYIAVWLIRILYSILPLVSISSIFSLIYTQGQLVPLTLLALMMLKEDENRLITKLFWLITVIEIIFVLGGGMKEGILQNLLPYLIYLFAGYKNGKFSFNGRFVTKIVVLFVFIVYVVFPYISLFREIADRKNVSWGEVTVKETMLEYFDYIMGEGRYSDEQQAKDKGLDYVLSRAGSIACNAWSINYASTKGLQPQYFYYCATAVVPRILWPDKPPVTIGGMMYKLATGHSDWETSGRRASVAYTIGFIGGCYFSFGIIGALIFPFVTGLFVGWFWHFLRPYIYFNPIAIWAFYTIIKTIFKDFENLTDGGFVFYVWSLAYFVIIKYIIPLNSYRYDSNRE